MFRLGPIAVDFHGDPQFRWTSKSDASGLRSGTFSGLLDWPVAHQLAELVDNPDRSVTIAGRSGVLEYVHFDDDLRGPERGWYLLESHDLGQAGHKDSLVPHVPFSLACTLVGDVVRRRIVVARSARQKPDRDGTGAQALVADPFGAEDFLVSPGGTLTTREFDPTHPHRGTEPEPDGGSAAMALRIGSTAALRLVAIPEVATDGPDPAPWISNRGGDVRGYDRRRGLEVYGPSHPLERTTDLVVTNGIVRLQVGNKGLPPFVPVQAIADGAWREVGCVQFGESRVLVGARFVKVTPDATTFALAVEGRGEVFITLKRGERMLRIATAAPGVRPTWHGMPPASRARHAVNWPGRFGMGVDGGTGPGVGTWEAPFPTWEGDARYSWDGSRLNPDFRLLWPPTISKAWSKVVSLTTEASAADSAGAGYLTIFDREGIWVGQVWLDEVDLRIKFRMGAHTVQSPVQAFAAGTDLVITVGYSDEDGMTLSVGAAGGAVSHAADPTAIAPVDGTPFDFGYFVNWSRWGDGDWGDGTWGGETFYPGGVVDNGMIFERRLTEIEVEALVAAVTPLGGLPVPEAALVWYAPFDVEPIPVIPSTVDGLAVDGLADEWGFTRGLAATDLAWRDAGVFLARVGPFESPAAQRAQFVAESEQSVRIGPR